MKLCRFAPEKSTLFAFAAGIAAVLLSLAMALFNGTPAETAINIFLRDFLMIYLLGFCFPLAYVQRRDPGRYAALGITKRKLGLSLALNALFAALLLAGLIFGAAESVRFHYKSLFAISYILAAGVFEMVFFYGFMRHYFETAFGIIPAILLTALFYSLHHAGFQPEFLKLFFVGILYCSVIYITGNIFIIFPFFWGVGAIWDVLINSSAGQSLQSGTSFIVALCLLSAMLLFVLLHGKGHGRNSGHAQAVPAGPAGQK